MLGSSKRGDMATSTAIFVPHRQCTAAHQKLPIANGRKLIHNRRQEGFFYAARHFDQRSIKTRRFKVFAVWFTDQRKSKITEDGNTDIENAKTGSNGSAFWKSVSFQNEIEKILLATLEKHKSKDMKVKAVKIAVEDILKHLDKIAVQKYTTEKATAAELKLTVEKSINKATKDTVTAVSHEMKQIAEEAANAIVAAKKRAEEAEKELVRSLSVLDDLPKPEAAVLSLEKTVALLENKLRDSKNEIEHLRMKVEATDFQAKASNARAERSEQIIAELQKEAEKLAKEHANNLTATCESLRAAALTREEAIKSVFQAHMTALEAATEAKRKADKVQTEATSRQSEALESSLAAAEASAAAWKKLATEPESSVDEDLEGIGDGRMARLLGAESTNKGPRSETPDWMKKRIQVAVHQIPPRSPAGLSTRGKSLDLPSSEEVWSIADAKVLDDLFSKEAAAKEALKNKRKDLEQALETKTIKRKQEEKLESGTGSGREIVFQGFNWESWRRKWFLDLAPKAADLAKCGITTVWLPPATDSVAPQGYMPKDLYNLNSAYGSMDDLKHCIREMHKQGLLVLGDVVLNHRCADKQSSNGIWNIFGGKLAWGPDAIVSDDPNFDGRGNPSSGDTFHAAPNIDHSQDFVRKDIKEYLLWLKSNIGFDGWRLDFVRGFWGGYVKEYIEASDPAFAIGEYWDSLVYEGGNLSYNQDSHRQRIVNWINATAGTSSAFDVTTKGILHSGLHNEYWRLIDPQQKPPGVMGWWPSRAVTFLENHDTGSTQGHWPFPREKLMQGYAYILTHPGTPAIFYDHFYEFGLHDLIADLVAARKRAGIHCRSHVKIFHANTEGYVAKIGDKLVLKLGHFDWNPSKQNILVGNWKRVIDQGADYQIWESS